MKRLTILVSLIVAATVPANGASAGPLTAADFAADCADGLVEVSGKQRYVGGDESLGGICVVTLAADSTFVLRDLTLSGSSLVVTGAVPNATVRVVDSTLHFTEFLELTPGAIAGEPPSPGDPVGVPENDATVIIRRSDLLAQAILITTSFDWPDGRIVIRDSQLESTTTNPNLGVSVRASDLVGVDGVVKVANSQITSQTFAQMRTGTDGRTVVRNNLFTGSGAIEVTTGAGGTCIATDNVPAVTCS